MQAKNRDTQVIDRPKSPCTLASQPSALTSQEVLTTRSQRGQSSYRPECMSVCVCVCVRGDYSDSGLRVKLINAMMHRTRHHWQNCQSNPPTNDCQSNSLLMIFRVTPY